MYKKLCDKIPCKLIVDSALGVALEEADIVLTGAEAVVENGGIINRVLTFLWIFCIDIIIKFVVEMKIRLELTLSLCVQMP